MKKDIEWLKEKVQKRIDKLPRTYSGTYIEGSRDAYDLTLQDINELDEPEVEQLDKRIRELESYNDELIRVNNQLRNEMDNQEILSQEENVNIVLDDLKEYIKEQQTLSQNVGMAHTPAGNDTYYRQYDYVLECINEYEPSDDLQNLLVPKQEEITEEQAWDTIKDIYGISNEAFVRSVMRLVMEHVKDDTTIGEIREKLKSEVLSQEFIDKNVVSVRGLGDIIQAEVVENLLVPKQELPVIPKFAADFLDGKEDYALYELLDGDFIYDNHDELARWLYDNDEETNKERELSLVLAHIHGYEVEVEQRYYVMNNDDRMMLVRMMDGKTITEADPFKLEDMYESEKKAHRLTEQEIKDYDPRYWAFAKPVEELEKWK